ncbi:MAG: nucleotidyltransferase domain-containing protein [Actinobacteria bacterium]|nr:nucleotidyltransferase domain-containing protein [Actinomycetota bacterium]
MERQSSPFVRIRYLDREAVREALAEYVGELSAGHPELERVVLFGSFARGDEVPSSDVDLLIVLDRSELPFLDRIPVFMPSRFPVGVDVFPYTREELESMLEEGNGFVASALAEGAELYRRPHSRE